MPLSPAQTERLSPAQTERLARIAELAERSRRPRIMLTVPFDTCARTSIALLDGDRKTIATVTLEVLPLCVHVSSDAAALGCTCLPDVGSPVPVGTNLLPTFRETFVRYGLALLDADRTSLATMELDVQPWPGWREIVVSTPDAAALASVACEFRRLGAT